MNEEIELKVATHCCNYLMVVGGMKLRCKHEEQ